jgi:hypothetical protein
MPERNEYVSPSSETPTELGDPATTDSRQPLKICLILNDGVVAWLDSIANQKGCQLNRSSVVRAIVGAFSKRGIRFSGAREEADISQMVGRALDYYLSSRGTPTPRPAQGHTTSDRANRVGAGKITTQTTVPPTGDQDDEAQDEANSASNFDFDRFMADRGYAPRSGYATYRPPQGKTVSAASDRAKVGPRGLAWSGDPGGSR